MRSQRILFLLLAAIVLPFAALAQSKAGDIKPTVILVSLDGFRYDYLDKYAPPEMNRVARDGVRAKWMTPSFPTKTFPNHYTIVTGLYPEHHGIVENHVYDFGEVFEMDDRAKVRDPKWWLGEPIWVTAEKQGQKASSFFWPGSEAEIGGVWASYWRNYNGRVPNDMRIDKVLGYLDLPAKERPTMITTYFSVTDDVGHEFGPDAEETKYGVWEVDRYIKRLMDGLKTRHLDNKVNVIIVSDHGMAPVYIKQVTFLDDYFDFGLAEKILWTNEIVQIFPKNGKLDEIYSRIKDLKHTTCWKKDDIPARLHYNEGKRIAPIVCSTEESWMTANHADYDKWYKGRDDLDRPRGAHGYDNKYASMRATFIAHGPAFKKGFLAEPFENVEVYNIMCKILGLTPAKNDGNIEHVKSMLR